jgi:hypothetical protein
LTVCISLGWAAPARANVVTDWNVITLRCVQGQGMAIPANRPGPVGLLDIALVQAAVHDAVQAIEGRYEPYHYRNASLRGVGSVDAAAAAAAYGVLAGLYKASDPNEPCLLGVADPNITYAGNPGLQAGNEAAAALLPLYRPTFASPIDPFIGGTAAGEWRPTPTAFAAGQNAFMAFTTPFVLDRTSQFRPERQPPLVSEIYTREYNEVKEFGRQTNSARTPDQTDLALFWTGNPISTWYTALRTIADSHITDVGDAAKVFALASFSAADAQMTVYESKYHFNFWRPVTAIWEGDNDGNPNTVGEPGWTPYIATPPYPEYSSGANCLAASILTTLQLHFGTDEFNFSVLSPVANVATNPRPYQRFSDAMQDVVDVRIYQGIHFRSADEAGRRQGARVAQWAFMKFLRPVPAGH